MAGPRRIVCLTEETTETLYRIGAADRIVGITRFTKRPPQARTEKPMVSAFTSTDIPAVLELQPDLVVGFSDIQADIAAELIRQGVDVLVTNQRSVGEILDTIALMGRIVDEAGAADRLVDELRRHMDEVSEQAARLPVRPRVYFEEWNDPLISGIRWVSEVIEIAGGDDIFPEFRTEQGATGRIVADPQEVVRRSPDIILASWCGKKFQKPRLVGRPGWDAIPAVRNDDIHELPAEEILQPGPAALGDGLTRVAGIVERWAREQTG